VKNISVVAIGGGTGLSTVLRGLKGYTPNLSGVVAITDNGGSSGVLRDELGVLPPGDIRNCIIALSDNESLMSRLMQYRFGGNGTLTNHSVGNIVLAALTNMVGDFREAVRLVSEILAIEGKVLPASLDNIQLIGIMEDGEEIVGETNIVKSGKKIKELKLDKEDAKGCEEAIEAIEKADLITIGPGSLYTSIISNLLINDIRRAVYSSKATKVLISNVMTQPGETDNLSLTGHIKEFDKYLSISTIDYLLLNVGKPPEEIEKRYESEGAQMLINDLDYNAYNFEIIEDALITLIKDRDGKQKIRHDPARIKKWIDIIVNKMESLDK